MANDSYRDSVLNALPTSWLDPLLTGPGAALPPMGTIGPQHVEALLRGIKARIEALPNGPSSRKAVLNEAEEAAWNAAVDEGMNQCCGRTLDTACRAIKALAGSDATSLPQEGK